MPIQGYTNYALKEKTFRATWFILYALICSPLLPALKNTLLLGPLTPDFYLQKAVFDQVFSSTVFHRFDTTVDMWVRNSNDICGSWV